MQSTEAYLELIHERGKRGLPLERVYRQLFNPALYLTAYGKIYRNAGAMTPGTTSETVDGMSLDKIGTIIEALRSERYHWQPARRIYIPKKNGATRPLGMPVWSDKILGEVLRMVLEAYFDPQFSPHSHGFRPNRGCHTALREIYHQWLGTTWFIEGDIHACFGALPHDLLLARLSEHIHDGRFINLMRGLLNAGYLEEWTFKPTLSGVPQGSIVSPILANILLDRLDKFVEETLLPEYTRGVKRKPNQEYVTRLRQARYHAQHGQGDEAQRLRRETHTMSSQDPDDPDYRRLKYVRYADDFLLGFIGPKDEAEAIKQRIATFLHDELHLELSHTKTLITHARSEAARFLGYEVVTIHDDVKRVTTKHSVAKRTLNGKIGLRVPRDVMLAKCERYKQNGKAIHRRELVDDSDFTIMALYQQEFRGIVEYYRLAYNLHTLNQLKWVMETSLTKTLANKYRISVTQVFQKYRAELLVHGQPYKGLQVVIPRAGQHPLIAQWGGIPLKWDIQATVEDQPPPIWGKRTELEKRLLAQVCEKCGARDHINVHHIRALKDLDQHQGRERPAWARIMAARRRKTLVLCRTCHEDIHAGRPLRRQLSSS